MDQVGSSNLNSRTDTIRRIVIRQTLEYQCQSRTANVDDDGRTKTYANPAPNTVLRAILLRLGSCKFQTMGTGKQGTIKSVSKLMIPAARYAAGRLAHRPPSILGFQLNANGRQSGISSRNTDTNQHTQTTMTRYAATCKGRTRKIGDIEKQQRYFCCR